MGSEPSRALQVVLPVVGAILGALLFIAVRQYVIAAGGDVLFFVAGILFPASLAYIFHPSLYFGNDAFGLRRAVAPAGLAGLGAALGLASPLGYLLLPPIWAALGALFQVYRSPQQAA